MPTDQATHRKLLADFERQRQAEGLFAWMRQVGLMQYGPVTPTPDQDLVSIDRLAAFRHKVLSFDAIKRRLGHEVSLDGIHEEAPEAQGRATPVDRHLHATWLTSAFD
jgi:hypothetical protein